MRRIAKRLSLALLLLVAAGGAYVAAKVRFPSWRPLLSIGPGEAIFIRNVRVFTATDAGVLEGRDVLVDHGVVTQLQATGAPPPPGARVIEGAGKTLLPGLFDAHTHLFTTTAPPWYLAFPKAAHNLEAYLYAGVTTIASMGDDPREIGPLRQRVERGELAGPRIVYAGSPITRTGGHPEASVRALVPWLLQLGLPEFSTQIDSPDQAEAVVERTAGAGAGFIKVVVDDLPGGMPRLEPAHLTAIVSAAHARGLKVAAHIGTVEDALRAVQCGVDLLNHGPNRGPMTDAQASLIAAAHVSVVPTMIVFERAAQLSERHFPLGELDRAIEAPEIVHQLSDEVVRSHQAPAFLRGWLGEIASSRSHRAAAVYALHHAGVPLLVGTDSSMFGDVPGASIHHEMQLLVHAGVPANEVLLGATSRAAAFFFAKPDFGSVAVGKVADLLLVDGNPDQDITATERISVIICRGRVLARR